MNPKVKSISSYKDSKREFSQNHLVLKEPITFQRKKLFTLLRSLKRNEKVPWMLKVLHGTIDAQ